MGGQRANALPQGEAVAQGKANFKRDGGRMEIRASDRAVINFRGFNIDRNEAVTFVQPGSKSRVLNRVTDGNPTQIFGQLKANGKVMLVNPSGVFFQNGSMVNVGGMIAAAGKISDEDFQAGRNRFTELSGEVNNAGTIRATGDVSLVGAHVSNSGIIESGRGMVSLVAGAEVLVGERGGNVYVSGAATPGKAVGVSNTGKIAAKKALLGAGDFYSVAVQHSGEIRAEEVALRGGKGGRVEVSGKIDASARGRGRKGGRIEVTGETVALKGATLDASGDKGGGEVLVGGDWQGKGAVSRAQTTTVDAATVIQADAVKRGAGGKVVVWADGATQFDGQISARGLGAGQAGGQVETSGKLTLGVGQTARVDASSPRGKMGNWLLDPTDLIIEAGGAGTIGGPDEQKVDASVINNASATVTLTATDTITFRQSVAMTTPGAGLTAIARGNLVVGDNMTIATNNGAINFTADSDKNGSGSLTLGVGSKLVTKGAAVTLTVDHGTAASSDGMTILGDMDTRRSLTGLGADSTFQVLGSNQNGVLTIGTVRLDGGQDNISASRNFMLRADEINFVGSGTPASVAGSVTGTGSLAFEQANKTAGMKLGAANNTTGDEASGQLDLTREELAAFADKTTGLTSFMWLTFGRLDSEKSLVIGDPNGAPLNLGMISRPGVTGLDTRLLFNSGSQGVIGNVDVQAPGVVRSTFRGNVISLKNFESQGILGLEQVGQTPVEILDMKPGLPPAPVETLRLDTGMLQRLAATTGTLELGSDLTGRTIPLTVKDDLAFSTAGSVKLMAGGPVIINEAINAGKKSLSIIAGDVQFGTKSDGTSRVNDLTGVGQWMGLQIYPSFGPAAAANTCDLEVYTGTRRTYDPDGNVLSLHIEDLNVMADRFAGQLLLGREISGIGGNTLINAELNFAGKKISGLWLSAPETVAVNQKITLGKIGTGTPNQALTLMGREVDLGADIVGTGQLRIEPCFNDLQPQNPLFRGMVVGATSQDPNRLTITEVEYGRIANTFSRINLGRALMGGHLEVAGFATEGGFKLKADTGLFANSTVKLNVATGGTLASDGALKTLFVRSLELDITRDVTDLSRLDVSFNSNDVSGELNPRRFVLNRAGDSDTKPRPDQAMDLNSSDLGHIKGSVVDLVIGYKHAENYSPVEVLNNWTLSSNTQLISTNGDITVSGSIDCAKALMLNTEGATRLVGSLGANTPLASLSISKGTDIAGVVQKTVIGSLGGPAVTVRTTGSQTFSESVELLSGGTLEAGGTLTVSQTLAAGANDLALLANEMLLNGGTGGVNGTRGLQLGAGTPATNMTFNGTTSVSGQLDLTQSKLQAINLAGFNKLTLGRANGTGTLSVKENFGLLQETLIQTGGGALNIEKQLDGAQKLTLSSGSGNITASAALGGTTALGDLTVLSTGTALFQRAVNAATVSTDAGGSTRLNGGAVTTSGLQDYNDAAVLGAATTLTSTGGGAVGINGGASGLHDLTVNTAGVTTLGGGINVGSITTDGPGSVRLSGGITTAGAQTYNEAATLTGATTLSSTGSGNVSLQQGVSGAFDLAVNTSGVTRLGGTVALGSLTTDAGGTVELPGTVTTSGSQTYNDAAVLGVATTLTSTGGGAVALNGGASGLHDLTVNTGGMTTLGGGINVATITTDGPGSVRLSGDIVTTGAQKYNDAAVLAGTTTLTSTGGGNLSLQNGLGGAFDLAVNTAGVTQLGGGINVKSVTTDAGGTVELGGVITTSGAQTYNENAVLKGATTLTSTGGGAVALKDGATGAFALVVNTAGVTRLGGTVALGSLTTDAGGTVELPGTVTTSGAQTYNDAAVLGAATTLTSTGGGAVALNGGASGLHDLTVNTGGMTTLGGGINVATITTDGPGSVRLSGDIVTTGAQKYNETATLTGATTLTSTGGGNVSLQNGVGGAFDLAVNTSGVTQLEPVMQFEPNRSVLFIHF
jgi:filamentous hemagglutinin family protein